jgi:SAM-dependent methyltransferase
MRYARPLPARARTVSPDRDPLVGDAAGDSPVVLVVADPEAYLLPEPALRLVADLASRPDFDVVLPVSNEPEAEEARCAPPFVYPTPTLLAEAAALAAASTAPIHRAVSPASPVYAVRRPALSALPRDLPLRDVPRRAAAQGFSVGLDPGAYLHRYGAMDASAREDLASRVPPSARAVLDVGCSRGATAPALRARGVATIVGIEPDAEDAAAAAKVYDRVLACRLDEVDEDFSGRFDAILFGDVLEHLVDPSDALARVRPWLANTGRLIASVPNAGHWSVVDDLIRGRFDYVPYGLLSGTHLRLFTRRTLEDLFAASGFVVESIDTVALPSSPDGDRRRARLKTFPGASADLDAAEFIAVARADRGR